MLKVKINLKSLGNQIKQLKREFFVYCKTSVRFVTQKRSRKIPSKLHILLNKRWNPLPPFGCSMNPGQYTAREDAKSFCGKGDDFFTMTIFCSFFLSQPL
jgi:hypothetical protein